MNSESKIEQRTIQMGFQMGNGLGQNIPGIMDPIAPIPKED